MILNDEQLAQDEKSLEAFRMAVMGNGIYLREGLVRDLFDTIVDLKRQIAVSAVDVMEAVLEMMGYGLPQDEPIDIRLVRKSLDAYVQEKVDRAKLEESEWFLSRLNMGLLPGAFRTSVENRVAANREKVKKC